MNILLLARLFYYEYSWNIWYRSTTTLLRHEILVAVVLCRLSPAIENLSPWLKIGDNRSKLFTIDCRNSVMVPSFSVTFGSFAVG